MSIESERDLRALRVIGSVVGRTLRTLEGMVRVGVSPAELDEAAGRFLAGEGARPSPAHAYGFPGAVMVSVNDQAVHALPSATPLRAGDLVKLDLTADRDGYFADAAVTVALPGADGRRIALRDCARGALAEGLRVARAGRTTRDIGRAVQRRVRADGFRVIPSLVGHGTGRAIHEEPQVPNYDEPLARHQLTRGLVLTVEPIICAGNGAVRTDPDGWTVRTADGSPVAHFEHTVVITDGSPVVLTAA